MSERPGWGDVFMDAVDLAIEHPTVDHWPVAISRA